MEMQNRNISHDENHLILIENDFFQTLIKQFDVGLFQCNPDGSIRNVNQTFGKILGYKSIQQVIDDSSNLTTRLNLQLINHSKISSGLNSDRSVADYEIAYTLNDGEKIDLQLILYAKKDQSGEITRLDGIIYKIPYRLEDIQPVNHSDRILEAISITAEEFLQSSDISASIFSALGRLGKVIGASRVFVYQNEWSENDELSMVLRYEWDAPGIFPLSETTLKNISFEGALNRWMEILSQNQIVQGNFEDFLESEQKILEEMGGKAIVLVPVLVELDWWGFIGYDIVNRKPDWYEDDVNAVKAIASVLGAGIQRKNMEEALRASQERFRTVAEFTHDWEYWLSPEGRFVYSSPSFEAITGYKFGYVNQDLSLFKKITHPDDFQKIDEHISKILVTPDVGASEFRIVTKEGQIKWISHVCIPIYNSKGEYLGQRASNRDVTNQKKAEVDLFNAKQALYKYVEKLERMNRLVTLLNEMGDLLQSCSDTKDIYRVFEEYYEKLFPNQNGALYMAGELNDIFERRAIFGLIPIPQMSIARDDCWALRRGKDHSVTSIRTKLRCQHVEHVTNSEEFQPYLCVPLISHGQTIGLLHINSIPISESEDIKQIALSLAERTALAITNINLREELHMQSIIDPLTGLYNRRFMTNMLDREIHRAHRLGNSLVVVMMDIDHFKQYNDIFGHDTGDALLQGLGQFLKSHIREEDIVCRYGGDEFIVVLPGTLLENAVQRIEQLRSDVKKMDIQYQGKTLKGITLSVGLAYFPQHGETEQELLHCADIALYRAKEEGRDRLVVSST